MNVRAPNTGQYLIYSRKNQKLPNFDARSLPAMTLTSGDTNSMQLICTEYPMPGDNQFQCLHTVSGLHVHVPGDYQYHVCTGTALHTVDLQLYPTTKKNLPIFFLSFIRGFVRYDQFYNLYVLNIKERNEKENSSCSWTNCLPRDIC